MDKANLSKVLAKLHFSSQLPESVQEKLAASAKVQKFPAGTVLFRENARNDDLMIIWVGRVALDIHVPEHGNIRIMTVEPGEVVGWSALLGGGKMTTSATALEDTQVVAFSAEGLQSACESNHSFGYFLMNKVAVSVAERLLDTRLQLVDLLTFEQAVGIKPKQSRR